MPTVYLFEARSIQTYLFEGGKLRDMIAASDQLDALCGTPLDQVLESLKIRESEIQFPRRSGGAIYAVLTGENSRENADKLQALWSLYVRTNMPGIEVVQVIENGEDLMDTMEKARERLTVQRNRMSVQFPIPGPLVRRSPRTGKAALSRYLYDRSEWGDEATHAKVSYRNLTDTKGLVAKFATDLDTKYWPNNLEPPHAPAKTTESSPDKAESKESVRLFPFIGQDRGIALIHADGNGLGELLRVLQVSIQKKSKEENDPKLYTKILQQFSKGMEAACQAAAQDATKLLFEAREHETANVPARPLVLGGDDLTIIVRADLAIPFATKFCQAFEAHTKEKFAQLFKDLGNPDELQNLTACAGISFIKSNQPFAQAHHLAESLCDLAKKQSRKWREEKKTSVIPSSISFHQVSAALIEDAKEVKKHEWEITYKSENYQLSLGCYGFNNGYNNIATLENLANLFCENGLNRNALREVANLIKSNWSLAEKRYIRWRDVSKENQPSQLTKFDRLLSELGCIPDTEGLLQLFNSQRQSPLVDLLAITALPKTPMQEAAA